MVESNHLERSEGISCDMKEENDFRKIEKVQLAILYGAIGLIVLVVIPYAFTFVGPLSQNPSDWGLFGDYFAGMLNPLLSFIAILVLLLTLGLTNQTLKMSKRQLDQAAETLEITREQLSMSQDQLNLSREELSLTREELQKSREITESHVKHLQNESLKNELYIVIRETDQEIQEVFERVAIFAENTYGYYFSYSATDNSVNEIPTHGTYLARTDRVAIVDLCELINKLDGYLDQYDQMFGYTAFTYHYKSKYSKLHRRLIEKEFQTESQFKAFKVVGYGWSAPGIENI